MACILRQIVGAGTMVMVHYRFLGMRGIPAASTGLNPPRYPMTSYTGAYLEIEPRAVQVTYRTIPSPMMEVGMESLLFNSPTNESVGLLSLMILLPVTGTVPLHCSGR